MTPLGPFLDVFSYTLVAVKRVKDFAVITYDLQKPIRR